MSVTLRWGLAGLMLEGASTKDKADAATLERACVRASESQLAHGVVDHAAGPRRPRSLISLVFPQEPTVPPSKGRQRVTFPISSVFHNLPLKERNAWVTLQFVITTGNVYMVTAATLDDEVLRTLIDLERKM